jgi:hypothetical protein
MRQRLIPGARCHRRLELRLNIPAEIKMIVEVTPDSARR